MRDHLGYRLALTGLETDGDLQPGGVLHVKLSLVNYGFARRPSDGKRLCPAGQRGPCRGGRPLRKSRNLV
ncbi:MAG: DUF4832 domain-containing protein [Oscillospiraceae bacterium]